VLLLLIGAVADALLTQMTYVELSRLRPARWPEARAGLGNFAARLFVAWLATAGVALALIALLRWLPPGPITPGGESPGALWEVGAGLLTVVTLVLEVLLWPVVALALLLGPVVVVEEIRPGAALGQWGRLVRQHLGRLYLYETGAAVVGLASLALTVPLALAAWGRAHLISGFDSPLGFSLCLLGGLAAAPLIAFLAVAHVFFFLTLRYEVGQRARPR
jgi:hypothetical protein